MARTPRKVRRVSKWRRALAPLALFAFALAGTLWIAGPAVAGKTFSIDLRHELDHKPRSVVPFQSAARVHNIRWDRWGGKSASGLGTVSVNNCKPNCAEGKFTRYPVTVKYKRKRSCLGKTAYVKFIYIFNRGKKKKPSGGDRKVAIDFEFVCSAPPPVP